MSQRALKDSLDVVYRKRLSAESFSAVISEQFNIATDWPYVVVKGFNNIVAKLSSVGSHNSMGFAPIVQAGAEQEKWEVCCGLLCLYSYPIFIHFILPISLRHLRMTTSTDLYHQANFPTLRASTSLAREYGDIRRQKTGLFASTTMTI